MKNNRSLILASKSPRRKYLLEQAGITVAIIPADIEEKRFPGESPEEYVKRLSREKAETIANQNPGSWVIGADTIVVINDTILEKPASNEDARQMLAKLSNTIHTVFTGYTLCCMECGKTITCSARTEVLFKHLSAREIEWYIRTGEPFDKAGAYAIQGLGTFLVRSINGSYTNVVGLPVCEIIELLVSENIIDMGSEDRHPL
ncbi:MAG: Maf family protein [Pseudomonadota bacterium]